MKRLGSWVALVALLAATLAGALSFDRRSWPGLVGDEATYLMQAGSLTWDGDLLYTRADYDRFLAHYGRTPEGLILQSDDGGRTIRYGKPAAYALFLAPFLRLAPVRGVALANALLLAAAALLAARALRRTLGPTAPLWVAAWVFASIAFAYVAWAHSDLFLMDLAAIGLALVYGLRDPRDDAERRDPSAAAADREIELAPGAGEVWARPERSIAHSMIFPLLALAVAGALLGLVTVARPFYGALLLPAALAVPRGERGARGEGRTRLARAGAWSGLAAFALGAALVVVPGLTRMADGDAWTEAYGGQRQSFDSTTGFPGVGIVGQSGERAAGHPGAGFTQAIASRGNRSWKPQIDFEPRQTAWNALYFLAGRHVGVIPYFLPLLLGFAAFRPPGGGRGRWALPVAVLLAAACFLLIRPFNFYGGGGAIANRYFLPLYPAFWFMAGTRPRWDLLRPLLAALLAAPFLYPLWSHPFAYLLDDHQGYGYVSDAARSLLPYETTLSHLKPAGRDDFVHNHLWIKSLATHLQPETRPDGQTALHLAPAAGGFAQLLIGSPQPLAGVTLDVLAPATPGAEQGSLHVEGSWCGAKVTPGTGSGQLAIHFARPRAVHSMWWTAGAPYYLYQLDLELRPILSPQTEAIAVYGVSFALHPLPALAPPPPPGPAAKP